MTDRLTLTRAFESAGMVLEQIAADTRVALQDTRGELRGLREDTRTEIRGLREDVNRRLDAVDRRFASLEGPGLAQFVLASRWLCRVARDHGAWLQVALVVSAATARRCTLSSAANAKGGLIDDY